MLADLETGTIRKLQHSHWLSGAAFSADGTLLATTSPDGSQPLVAPIAIAERLDEFGIETPQPARLPPETEGPFQEELAPMMNLNRISIG